MTEIKPPIKLPIDTAKTGRVEADISTVMDYTPAPARCQVGLHGWSRWSGLIIEVVNGQMAIAQHRYQCRICLYCGKRKERVVR